MSLEVALASQTIHADPILSSCRIELEEESNGKRWLLWGVAPTAGLKRRAGTIARHLSPASVWLVNRIIVEPDCPSSQAAA